MQPQPPRQRLTRRLLKLLAAAGASASGAYLLYESARWLDYEQVTAPMRRPFEPVSTEVSQKRELVRYATPARYRTRRAGRSSRSS